MTAKDQELTAPGVVPEIIFPPGDLYSDEPPLESYFHLRRLILMLTCLEWYWHERQDFFAARNLTIYDRPNQRKSEDFCGSDLSVALGTERRSRRSWIVWEEDGKYPNVIAERYAKIMRGCQRTMSAWCI